MRAESHNHHKMIVVELGLLLPVSQVVSAAACGASQVEHLIVIL
jgi:hypothetical protein